MPFAPSILTWDDKHGSTSYFVSSHAELQSASREILEQRLEQHYFVEPDETVRVTWDEEMAVLADAPALASLPEAVQKAAKAAKASKARAYSAHQDLRDEWDLVHNLVAGRPTYRELRNGKLQRITPWDVLCERCGFEYEHVSLDRASVPEVFPEWEGFDHDDRLVDELPEGGAMCEF